MAKSNGKLRHELSNPFGEASKVDLDALASSMRERGYDGTHPITMYEGRILDGWHRYLASREAKVEPVFRDFEGTLVEARSFVYAENIPRRHMNARQKAAAQLCMNAWLPPDKQLTIAEIQVRTGLKSGALIKQLQMVAKKAPEALNDVVSGELDAGVAIRQQINQDPAGGSKEGTGLDMTRPEVLYTIKNKRLIQASHEARLKAGHTKQAACNKAFELYVEWASYFP